MRVLCSARRRLTSCFHDGSGVGELGSVLKTLRFPSISSCRDTGALAFHRALEDRAVDFLITSGERSCRQRPRTRHSHLLCWPWSSMHPRNFVFITLMTLCHLQLAGQMLTNPLPPPQRSVRPTEISLNNRSRLSNSPTIPDRTQFPSRQPEPIPRNRRPVHAGMPIVQTWAGETCDAVRRSRHLLPRLHHSRRQRSVYNRSTSELRRRRTSARSPAAQAMPTSPPRTATCASACIPRASMT